MATNDLCACGCGVPVRKKGRRWLRGHHWRGVKRPGFTKEHRDRIRAARARQGPSGRDKTNSDAFARMAEDRRGSGNPMFGRRREATSNWKGGTSAYRGYVFVRAPEHPNARNGYVAEHVLVVERSIGRLVRKGEVVHHINGRRSDNRPENLWLCSAGRHRSAHASTVAILGALMERGLVSFDRAAGRYKVTT